MDFSVRLAKLYEKNLNTCKSAAIKLDQLKTEQIENQKKTFANAGSENRLRSSNSQDRTQELGRYCKKGIASNAVTANTVNEAVMTTRCIAGCREAAAPRAAVPRAARH